MNDDDLLTAVRGLGQDLATIANAVPPDEPWMLPAFSLSTLSKDDRKSLVAWLLEVRVLYDMGAAPSWQT